MYLIVLLLLVLVLYYVRAMMPSWIGARDERFVAGVLGGLDSEQYVVLHDIMLPSVARTGTTQIDHVVVSPYGVFCVETKAHKGWIFGRASDKYWTQVIYRSKHRFYNPLRQNYAHQEALEDIISTDYPNLPVIGLVAFPSAERLKVTGSNSVGRAKDVLGMILSYNQRCVSDDEVKRVYELILAENISDSVSRRRHKHRVRTVSK